MSISRLPGLPDELLILIVSYIPDLGTAIPDSKTVQNLKGTCRRLRDLMRDIIKGKGIRLLKGHPFLCFLIEKSPQVCNKPYTQMMGILDRYLKIAGKIGNIKNASLHYSRNFARDVGDLQLAHQNGFQIEPINPNNSVRDLMRRTNKITLDDLFLTAVLFKEKCLIESCNLEIIQRSTIDFAAYFCLLNNTRDLDLFNKMLPHTSIFGEDNVPSPQWNEKVLQNLLIAAAQENQMVIFRELLALKKYYNANQLLTILANLDRGNAIAIFLASEQVYEGYVPDNAWDHIPGLHTALMNAANLNHQAAFNAILQARPGQKIDRRILEQIRDLFQNDPPEEAEASHFWNGWRERRDNYPDRSGIIQRLNDEIAQRYPEATAAGVANEEAKQPSPQNPLAEEPMPPPVVLPVQEPLAIGQNVDLSRRQIIAALVAMGLASLWTIYSNFFSTSR